MIHSDTHYGRPVVYKMTTSLPDKFIQLDTWENVQIESPDKFLGNTFLRPVSFVSDKAAVYEEVNE